MKKRFISLFVMFAMLLSLVPTMVMPTVANHDPHSVQLIMVGSGQIANPPSESEGWWVFQRSAPVVIDGNKEYTVEFTTPIGSHPAVVQLALVSEGGSFDENAPFAGATQAPAYWWDTGDADVIPQIGNVAVVFNDTVPLTIKPLENTNLVQQYHPPANGFVSFDLWNAYYEGGQNLVGGTVVTVGDGAGAPAFGLTGGAAITSISVTFTITNMTRPDDRYTICEHCNLPYDDGCECYCPEEKLWEDCVCVCPDCGEPLKDCKWTCDVGDETTAAATTVAGTTAATTAGDVSTAATTAATPATTGGGGPVTPSEPVWVLDMSKLAPNGIEAKASAVPDVPNAHRTLGGPDYRPGVRHESSNVDHYFTIADGNVVFTNTNGSAVTSGWRRIFIMTGSGAGGTGGEMRVAADAFTPEAGKRYRLEIEASTPTAGVVMRVEANRTANASDNTTNDTRSDFTLGAAPQTFRHTWTQGSTANTGAGHGGNIGIELPGGGSVVTFSSIKIYELGEMCTRCGAEGCAGCEAYELYDMQKDDNLDEWEGGNFGTDFAWLNANFGEGDGLSVTGTPPARVISSLSRSGTSQGVGIKTSYMNVNSSYRYGIEFTGTFAGTTVRLIPSNNTAGSVAVAAPAAGQFSLSYKVSGAELAGIDWLRLGSVGGGDTQITYTNIRVFEYRPEGSPPPATTTTAATTASPATTPGDATTAATTGGDATTASVTTGGTGEATTAATTTAAQQTTAATTGGDATTASVTTGGTGEVTTAATTAATTTAAQQTTAATTPATTLPTGPPQANQVELVAIVAGEHPAGQWWQPQRGTRVTIQEGVSNTYTATMSLAAGDNPIVQLGLLSAGGGFNGFAGAVQAPAGWWNSQDPAQIPQIIINSVSFNGNSVGVDGRDNDNLVQQYDPNANGFIDIQLWNGFYMPNSILQGVTNATVGDAPNTGTGFRVPNVSNVNTVAVSFSIIFPSGGAVTTAATTTQGGGNVTTAATTTQGGGVVTTGSVVTTANPVGYVPPTQTGDGRGAPVRLMAREAVDWQTGPDFAGPWRSNVVTITGDGLYTFTMNTPGGYSRFIHLGLYSDGATFEDNYTMDTATRPVHPWGDAMVEFVEVKINGVVVNTTNWADANEFGQASLISVGWFNPARGANVTEGFVDIDLWNAWHGPNQRLAGVRRVEDTEAGWDHSTDPRRPAAHFELTPVAPINTVEVTIHVRNTGVLMGGTPPGRLAGRVLGSSNVSINDALEVLKFLAKLPSALTVGAANTSAADAMAAARITVGATANPTINCALEILKFLAKLPSLVPAS